MSEPTPPTGRESTEKRIVAATMALMADGGRSPVSTRAVCDAAGVQPPTIYRLFGSMDGLFNAVAREGFLLHQRGYGPMVEDGDPVAVLRWGWDQHVAFGLANPYLYSVMYGRADPAVPSFAAVAANEGLAHAIHRVAEAGLLGVDEHFAAWSVTAAGVGVTFTLLATPEQDRSLEHSARVREQCIASITTSGPRTGGGVVGAAVTLKAALGADDVLHAAERALLELWLDRLATAPPEGGASDHG